MRDLYKYVLVGVMCLLIGAAGTALAMHTGGGDVRIVAQRQEDGSVRVGLQDRLPNGEWSEPHLPQRGVVPADAEVGRWLGSSPLDVGAGKLLGGQLVCIVDHSQPDDRFWFYADLGYWAVSEDLKINLRNVSGPTPERQAELIRECVADGAGAIAVTLAAPDVLAPAIEEALAAGAQVVTFNSGADHSFEAGSAMHIGLDDRAGGVRAGTGFNEAGVSGVVLCVVHEAQNIGLEERCEGLADSYDGEVERFPVHEAGTGDLDGVRALLEARIAEGSVGGILLLNDGLLDSAIAARGDQEVKVGTFGSMTLPLASRIVAGEVLFLVYDQPQIQGYLTGAALGIVGLLGRFGDARLLTGGTQILIEPVVWDQRRTATALERLAAEAGWQGRDDVESGGN